jgi:hypothetical protein
MDPESAASMAGDARYDDFVAHCAKSGVEVAA